MENKKSEESLIKKIYFLGERLVEIGLIADKIGLDLDKIYKEVNDEHINVSELLKESNTPTIDIGIYGNLLLLNDTADLIIRKLNAIESTLNFLTKE